MINREIKTYMAKSRRCLYEEWRDKLPVRKKSLVDTYVLKISRGGSKNNVKALGSGLFEIKIRSEGGLRVYFGEEGLNIILLLAGGDKGSQHRDIQLAKKLWDEYGK